MSDSPDATRLRAIKLEGIARCWRCNVELPNVGACLVELLAGTEQRCAGYCFGGFPPLQRPDRYVASGELPQLRERLAEPRQLELLSSIERSEASRWQ